MKDKLRIILLYKKFVFKYLNYHLNFSKKQYYLKDLVDSHLFSLLEVLVEFQVMSEKQYKVLLIDLENIYHCMIGWIKSEGRSS